MAISEPKSMLDQLKDAYKAARNRGEYDKAEQIMQAAQAYDPKSDRYQNDQMDAMKYNAEMQAKNKLGRAMAAMQSNQFGQNALMGGMYQQNPVPQTAPWDPNEDAAYAPPLSNLITMWQARFGDKWVNIHTAPFDSSIQAYGKEHSSETVFWSAVLNRMKNNNLFELNPKNGTWLRLKEDV